MSEQEQKGGMLFKVLTIVLFLAVAGAIFVSKFLIFYF